jgi:hypothetical protein
VNPTRTPSGVLNNGGEKREKKKINNKNSGPPKFAPLVACTLLGPKVWFSYKDVQIDANGYT